MAKILRIQVYSNTIEEGPAKEQKMLSLMACLMAILRMTLRLNLKYFV